LRVTYRSIVVGLILIPLNALWLATTEVVWISGQPTTLSLFYNVIWILFWLIAGNLLLERLRPSWALTPAELLVVYTMLSIASALGSLDFIDVLIPMMTAGNYYKNITGSYKLPERWVPDWLEVTDPAALQAYFLGQESIYNPAIYKPWIIPFLAWGAFILGLCAVMWGLNLVFREQWTEHEKLAYPVIQLPMRLSTGAKDLFRNKLFWTAFVIAGFIDVVNGLNVLFPLLPKIKVVYAAHIETFFTELPWSAMGPMPVSFYPFAIGICFFMPLDLAFSCWFFFFFWKAQRVLASHIGMHGMPGFPFVEEQTAGGYYALALLALWISRRHIAHFFGVLHPGKREAMTRLERQDAYTAGILITTGMGVVVGISLCAGMTPGVTVSFFLLYFLLSVGITRMRAELGHPSHDLHFAGPNLQIIDALGMKDMNRSNLAMLSFYHWFNRAYRGHPMPHGMEGFRIAERLHLDHRRYLVAMAAAIVAGLVCGFWGLLLILNRYGGAQVSGLGDIFGVEAWNFIDQRFTAPEAHHFAPAYALGIGLVFAMGLAVLRMALPWWPFHPVGYAVSGSWSMEQLWMSILTAWLVKSVLLRFGGAKMFDKAVPFFLGLIVGDFMVGGFWNLYGAVMGVKVYHFWPY
jgi:hypothetical protein